MFEWPTLAKHCPTLLKDMQEELRDADDADDVERWSRALLDLRSAEEACEGNLERRYRNAIEELSAASVSEGIDDLRRALGRVVWDRLKRNTPVLAGSRVAMFPKPQDRGQRGRPQSLDRVRVESAASMWLDWNDSPKTQAELVRVLANWCGVEGIDLCDRTIREVAAVAIRRHNERRGRLA